MEEHIRLPQVQVVGNMTSAELLEKFWQASHVPKEDSEVLQALALEILASGDEETADPVKRDVFPLA